MNSREPRNGAMGVAETREVVAVLMRQTISNLFIHKLADGFLEGRRDLVADFAKVGELEIDLAVFSDLDVMHRICNQKKE